MQLHDPRAIGLCQDVALRSNVSKLVLFEHFSLDQTFQREDLVVALALHQFHLTERALADDLAHVVIIGRLNGSQRT